MRTYAFIDASNLFYGFDTEYGWRIDYSRFKKYLEEKYEAKEVLYFGGIDTRLGIYPNREYFHDYSTKDTVDLDDLIRHFENILKTYKPLSEAQIVLANKYIQRAKFYRRLQSFGYKLFIKPVKRYEGTTFDTPKRKANCDVDLTLQVLSNIDSYDRAVVVSGDGDFLPLYKYLESKKKDILVLSRSSKVAGEVTRHLGTRFLEIRKLQPHIEYFGNGKNSKK